MYQTWMDIKYANLLSNTLKKFKVKNNNPYLANCRCHICGDSSKSTSKARGYIYQIKDRIRYRCHNCGVAYTFPYFLKIISPLLHEEYVREKFIARDEEPVVFSKPEFTVSSIPAYMREGSPLRKLKKISQLKWDHPAKQYIVNRKIPNFSHSKLFYCPKFASWVNTMVPGKLSEERDEPRLIIPFFDENKNMFGFQGRSFASNAKIRYITIILDSDKPKLFGLDTVDKSKRVYVVEGPIDSMFLTNAVAMAGSDVKLPLGFNDVVFVLDNEPRNREIVKKLDNLIEKGYNVCIWPSNVQEKDTNDMVLTGMDGEDVQFVINNNTYSGLMAKVKLNEWKKI